jgi:SAM-dependent methyltransferase
MNAITPIISEQARLWNGSAGRGWVAAEAALDQMFAGFDPLLADGIAVGRVLDVGCGTGSTTMALARRLGDPGDVTGVDHSQPMIEAARIRAEREGVAAHFIQGDAQTYAFAPTSFDAVISRFGVMFFADPVQAFANLRRATRPGGHLRFAAWRCAAENPFMIEAEAAAAPLLPGLAVREPDAPGQFAFADRDKVFSILKDSGWAAIDIQPVDVACRFAAAELENYLAFMGPVGRTLQRTDDATRLRVMDAVRPAFDSFVYGKEVRFTAACWMVNACAPRVSGLEQPAMR